MLSVTVVRNSTTQDEEREGGENPFLFAFCCDRNNYVLICFFLC